MLLWGAAAILGPPLVYALAAFGLAFIPVNGDFRDSPGGVEVYLLSNGIHVDFLVPASNPVMDWSAKMPRKDFRGVDDGYDGLLLGWGNRASALAAS